MSANGATGIQVIAGRETLVEQARDGVTKRALVVVFEDVLTEEVQG